MRRAITVMLLLIAIGAGAQSIPGTDQILIPLAPQTSAGAFGSDWETTLALTNISDTAITVLGYEPAAGCQVQCTPPPPIGPHATIVVRTVVSCNEVRGVFLFVEHGRFQDLAVTLRSRDLSRQSDSWGTNIPVLLMNSGPSQRFGLTDIPVDPQFRSTLRLYALSQTNTAPPTATVRAFAVDPQRDFPTSFASDTPLFETTLPFIVPVSGGGTTGCPAFTELSLSGIPQLSGHTRIRVEVQPLTNTNYWGLASITNNNTQEVTVISPN